VNTVLWIITGLLAVIFLAAGMMKLAKPKDELAANPNMAWSADLSPAAIKTIGALEVLAAIGLIAPALLGVAPILVPLAALGIVALMIGAAITHARRKEPQSVGLNVALLVLAAVVAWGRLGPYAF
jgi:uncharacterized membrane protein YphA (DoxX/SURF4 family)